MKAPDPLPERIFLARFMIPDGPKRKYLHGCNSEVRSSPVLAKGGDRDRLGCMRVCLHVQAAVVLTFVGFLSSRLTSAIVTYTNLSSFAAAAGSVDIESFEQLPPLAFENHPPTVVGPFTLSSSQSYGFGILTTGPTQGQHATSGTYYLAFNARVLLLTFAQPITALSLDFIDFGDFPAYLKQELTMTTSAGDSFLIAKTVEEFALPNGNEIFFGFTSDVPLTEVTFHTSISDNVAIDSMRYAYVPESSTMVLGLCGAGWILTRRRGRRIGPAN